MERNREFEKKSLFLFLKNKYTHSYTNEKDMLLGKVDLDILKIKLAIDEIETLTKNNEIQKIACILKDLEVLLPSYNNNKKLMQIFYHSKMFLPLINLIDIIGHDSLIKLLNLLEKLFKNNKNLSKYLSKNYDFINSIMKLMMIPEYFEICIKICEDLFINSHDLIPISKLIYLKKIYVLYAKSRLDTLCRILAILMFDHKKMEFKQIFKYKNYLKIRPLFKITSENQSLCLNFSNFIPQLVATLKSKLTQVIEFVKLSYSLRDFEGIDNTNLSLNSHFKNDNFITMNNHLNEPFKDRIKVIIESLKIKNLMNQVLRSSVFDNLIINWDLVNNKENKQNIFNTYIKMTKLIKNNSKKTQSNEKYSQYIVYLKYTTYQIEMFFVLSTLLGGKRKSEVQDIMTNLNIIDMISNYIDYIDWGNIHGESNRQSFDSIPEANLLDENAYHGLGCKCDCDSALKIQYLRFIYTFCCRDTKNISNKLQLISEFDKENCLKQGYILAFYKYFKHNSSHFQSKDVCFNKSYYETKEIFNTLSSLDCDIDKSLNDLLFNQYTLENFKSLINCFNNRNNQRIGLLNKLIYNYVLECQYSSSKFWLASCIEVILRGNNSFIQFFVANSGLIPCLLYDILYSKSEKIALLQMSFDLLGELVKFNKANFMLLNNHFVDSNELKLFCSKIISKRHLIDSNVFLRAVFLSIEKINEQDKIDNKQNQSINDFLKNCKICSFVNSNRVNIFYYLIQLVKPDDINQTNISCINTSLIILIIEYDKGKLAEFLENIRKILINSQEILENYKNLLLIWKQFYNFRPKDCSSLEHSTTIGFKKWYEVSNILLEIDENKPSSLYYINKI